MKKTLFLWLTLLLSAVCVSAQRLEGVGMGSLCEGDLLFCAQVKGNNITDVTQGVGGMKIDHVAIFHRQGGRTFALEAIHSGVGLTPTDSFMARREVVLAARLRDTLGVARSVERALRFIGRPYDFNFMPDDSAFYCSELVQKCYRDSRGELVFKPIPMSFHDQSGRITPYWHDYYARQGLQVPEGEPGSNPGDLSRSAAICILGIVEKE
ncbi:YiiX/YebB-like N1pC/P60 family cysteine hydrolase [uncultured Prevotella sp.]|uniref:YiiX/YebB-like N1pC/P60 family cysteine hydrolase n=1 Tax=uncultured Prevotella sp. TaxID=159272 RepID=UPI002604AD96|nr:YiiX/YebB-like N1pC/P60 family cysteine hydrolase [uncultured Prevotella sp.]